MLHGFLTLGICGKCCGQARNAVIFCRREAVWVSCLCYSLVSIFDSTLPYISQLILSLFPLFSECAESVHAHTPPWWSAYGMHVTAHACVHKRLCARMCVDFSCRGVDHNTAVNLKGKLINWSPSDSLTSSPRNGLLLPNLGKELPRAPGEERPPSLLPPSHPLHLTDYEFMSKGREEWSEKKKKK